MTKENREDLIKKGNMLMAAARAGIIGISEDEIRDLQKNFILSVDVKPRGEVFGYFALGLMFLSGLVFFIAGSLVFFVIGFALMMYPAFLIQNGLNIRRKSERYLQLVESEFQKIEKRDAA